MHISFQIIVCLDTCAEVEWLDRMATLFLAFLRKLHTISIVAALVYVPTKSVAEYPLQITFQPESP